MLFTDKVRITATGIDPVFSNGVDGDSVVVKAYIENNTKLRYGNDGSPYVPDYLIFLPAKTEVSLEDKIEIVEIHGQAPVGDEVGSKTVAQIKRVGGFSVSHLEVLV